MTEAQLHAAVVQYLRLALPEDAVLHHSPNESDGSPRFTRKQMGMGMMPGWPDLEIVWQGFVFFIELKAGKRKPSDNQNACHEALEATHAPVAVCRSVVEVQNFLRGYMPLRARVA